MQQTIEWYSVMDNPPDEDTYVIAAYMSGWEVHVCKVFVWRDDEGYVRNAGAYDMNENTIEDFEPYYWTPIPYPKGEHK